MVLFFFLKNPHYSITWDSNSSAAAVLSENMAWCSAVHLHSSKAHYCVSPHEEEDTCTHSKQITIRRTIMLMIIDVVCSAVHLHSYEEEDACSD
jgi:hypothetical protein